MTLTNGKKKYFFFENKGQIIEKDFYTIIGGKGENENEKKNLIAEERKQMHEKNEGEMLKRMGVEKGRHETRRRKSRNYLQVMGFNRISMDLSKRPQLILRLNWFKVRELTSSNKRIWFHIWTPRKRMDKVPDFDRVIGT